MCLLPEVWQEHQGCPGQRQVCDGLVCLLGQLDQRQHELRHSRLLCRNTAGLTCIFTVQHSAQEEKQTFKLNVTENVIDEK